jgi:hypothetical protein
MTGRSDWVNREPMAKPVRSKQKTKQFKLYSKTGEPGQTWEPKSVFFLLLFTKNKWTKLLILLKNARPDKS